VGAPAIHSQVSMPNSDHQHHTQRGEGDVRSLNDAMDPRAKPRTLALVLVHLMWISLLGVDVFCYGYYYPQIEQRIGDEAFIPYALAVIETTAIATVFDLVCLVLIVRRWRPSWPLLVCIALSVPLYREFYVGFIR
jgi:hypothetical protein